ncbi:YczE/YyaS/YitT family protein [Streptomyces seoulensis]|uniref:YczE/YyaS/YitT family protein n=1 Tax=Streptomyces seoulensis TaxID=73044 RepID=UPI003C2FA104
MASPAPAPPVAAQARQGPPVLARLNALAQFRAGRTTRRVLQLLVGLVGYGAAVMTLVLSGLGAASWNVLTEGTAGALGVSFGWATNLISLTVLLAWVPLRELPGLGTLLNVAVVGFAADATAVVLPRPQGTPAAIAYLVLGLVALAFFDALYLGAQFGSGPRDGIMTGLVRLTRLPVAVVRTGIDVAVAGTGWLMGGTVGAGTVLVALCMGPLVGLFLPRVAVRLPVDEADGRPTLGTLPLREDEDDAAARPHQ